MIVGFRLTITNGVVAIDLQNFSTKLNTCTVSSNTGRGTMLSNVFLQAFGIITRTRAWINCITFGGSTIEDVEASSPPMAMKTISFTRDLHGHIVGGNRLICMWNIGSRITCLEVSLYLLTPLVSSIVLSSSTKSGFNTG